MAFTLAATTRTIKGQKVRYTGQLPAVVYGAASDALSLAVSPTEFLKLYKQAGASSLVDLHVDGKETGKVLIQDVQVDPVKGAIIHVDLRRIDMNKAMHAPVTLRFVGEPPVVKAMGGTLVTTIHTVEVKCLPKDLVGHLDVDLSGLNSFDQVIKIKDIALPAGIEIVSPNADDLVVKASRALTDDEIKAMEDANASADVSKIASVKEEKKAEEAAKAEEAGAADGKKEEKKEEKK